MHSQFLKHGMVGVYSYLSITTSDDPLIVMDSNHWIQWMTLLPHPQMYPRCIHYMTHDSAWATCKSYMRMRWTGTLSVHLILPNELVAIKYCYSLGRYTIAIVLEDTLFPREEYCALFHIVSISLGKWSNEIIRNNLLISTLFQQKVSVF